MQHRARTTITTLLTWLIIWGSIPTTLLLIPGCKTVPPAITHYTTPLDTHSTQLPPLCRYPFYPGELLAYRLFAAGISAGTAWMRVNPGPDADQNQILFEGEIRGGGFLDFFHPTRVQAGTMADTDTLYPYTYNQTNLSGNRHVIHNLRFNKEKTDRVQVQREEKEQTKTRTVRTLPNAVDPLTAIFTARAIITGTINQEPEQVSTLAELTGIEPENTESRPGAPAPGPHLISMFDGRRTRIITIEQAGTETIETLAGKFNTVKYQGQALTMEMTAKPIQISTKQKPMDFTVWLTDDDYALPVKAVGPMPFGEAEVELEKMVINQIREQCIPLEQEDHPHN